MTFSYILSNLQWLLIIIAAIIIGMAKGGIKGIDMLNILLMAYVFGGKSSTGIVLPLFCFADIMAVIYYKRHVKWEYFWKLTPPLLVGVLLGSYLGKDIDDVLFKKIMSVIVILTVFLLLWIENKKDISFPKNPFFSTSMGLTAGFASMMGNLAGAFSNVYFLATRISKNDYIGTAAWVFLVANLFKMPLQIWAWHNINWESLKMDLVLLPALILGFFIGVKFIKLISDGIFRKIIMSLTVLGSILILIS